MRVSVPHLIPSRAVLFLGVDLDGLVPFWLSKVPAVLGIDKVAERGGCALGGLRRTNQDHSVSLSPFINASAGCFYGRRGLQLFLC